MSTGTAGVSLIEAPSSGVPGGGFYGSISGFLEEHGLLLTTKLSLQAMIRMLGLQCLLGGSSFIGYEVTIPYLF